MQLFDNSPSRKPYTMVGGAEKFLALRQSPKACLEAQPSELFYKAQKKKLKDHRNKDANL